MIDVLVSWLGLFFGAFLGIIKSIRVELKPGERYFKSMQRVIIAAILVLLVVFRFNKLLLIIFIILFFIGFFFKREKSATQFHYMLFGILVFFIVNVKKYSPLFLSLIFIYGFPTGTLFVYREKERNKLRLFLLLFVEYLHYLVVALGLITVFG